MAAKVIEKVDHPQHYQSKGMEVIDIIEAYELDFHLGNAIKYILRAGKKEGSSEKEDLGKAAWYIQRKLRNVS